MTAYSNLSHTQVGMVFAASVTTTLINEFKVEAIIFTGVAGWLPTQYTHTQLQQSYYMHWPRTLGQCSPTKGLCNDQDQPFPTAKLACNPEPHAFAGGLKAGQHIGDVVLGKDVVNYEFDCRSFTLPFDPDYKYQLGAHLPRNWPAHSTSCHLAPSSIPYQRRGAPLPKVAVL